MRLGHVPGEDLLLGGVLVAAWPLLNKSGFRFCRRNPGASSLCRLCPCAFLMFRMVPRLMPRLGGGKL